LIQLDIQSTDVTLPKKLALVQPFWAHPCQLDSQLLLYYVNFRMKNMVFQALADAAREREPVALGIISSVKGSSPQKLGAKALFYADGRIKGTLGGGCLEAEIQQRAIQTLRTGKAETFDLLLDHDFGWDDGLICGGKVFGVILPNAQKAGQKFWNELAGRQTTQSWGVKKNFSITRLNSLPLTPSALLYHEAVTPPCLLWIAGAGHIAQAVAPLAVKLDFSVTIFDDRPALVNHRYFPAEVNLQAEVWEKMLSEPLPDSPGFALIVTRGHRHDALVLKDWIHKPFLFLCMIGSARKSRTIFEHFTSEQIATPAQLKRVACPVGIQIRSQSVEEIAVSIMAQFIEKRAELVHERKVSASGKLELVHAHNT
jgi:xanthine dehydrogenase accessory factor